MSEMKVSELISELETLKNVHGDLVIKVYDEIHDKYSKLRTVKVIQMGIEEEVQYYEKLRKKPEVFAVIQRESLYPSDKVGAWGIGTLRTEGDKSW